MKYSTFFDIILYIKLVNQILSQVTKFIKVLIHRV